MPAYQRNTEKAQHLLPYSTKGKAHFPSPRENGRLQQSIEQSPQVVQFKSRQSSADNYSQRKASQSGLPDQLKAGVERLSGIDMSDTKVHYNSNKPGKVNAHAYAQGNQIHLAPGQEKHLAHEAWHVVQQKQGRVKPTIQFKGVAVNTQQNLEHEADVMGQRAMQPGNVGETTLSQKPVKQEVAQMAGGWWDMVRSAVITTAKILEGIAPVADPQLHEVLRKDKKDEMEAKYGIALDDSFGLQMLRAIEEVLENLPTGHTHNNASLTNITRDDVDGRDESSYDGNTNTVNIRRPTIPGLGIRMTDAIYLALDKRVKAQRDIMNASAIPAGITDVSDNLLNLNFADRHIMEGVSDVNSRELLFNWTIRHEIGHSVDNQINWSANQRYTHNRFGGWKRYNGNAEHEAVGIHFLLNAGFTAAECQQPINVAGTTLADRFRFIMIQNGNAGAIQGVIGLWRNQNNHAAGYKQANFDTAIRNVLIARSAPWSFNDGCVNEVGHEGKNFHLDLEAGANWWSYKESQRPYAVSNYQFKDPHEWFAEAYAAYFHPDGAESASRRRLRAATRIWFAANLDHDNAIL